MKSLWDKLKEIGFIESEYPKNTIDIFSEKYKLINFFHKTEYTISKNILVKLNMMVYFDDWHVDFYSYDESSRTFNKDYSVSEIFNYIKKVELRVSREYKLKRIKDGRRKI